MYTYLIGGCGLIELFSQHGVDMDERRVTMTLFFQMDDGRLQVKVSLVQSSRQLMSRAFQLLCVIYVKGIIRGER